MAKQYEQMKLSDRPKRWKQKAFDVMNEAVHTRQESLLTQFSITLVATAKGLMMSVGLDLSFLLIRVCFLYVCCCFILCCLLLLY